MKNNFIPFKVEESPLDPWPNRYFVFAQISEIRFRWDEVSYYHHFGHYPQHADQLVMTYKNIPLKLYQPYMRLSDAQKLLEYLEPVGFSYVIEDDVKFVYDTFSEDEAYQLWNYVNNYRNMKAWIRQAYLPMPDEDPLSYTPRSQPCSCGVIDFTCEQDYRLSFSTFGFFDVIDSSYYMEPSKKRMMREKLIMLVEDSRVDLLEEVFDHAQKLFDKKWEEKLADEKRNSGHSGSNYAQPVTDYFIEDTYFFLDHLQEEDLYDNRDVNHYYRYYYDEDYDYEDFEDSGGDERF
jgi:hypothetical protein